jgi:hypothetical protein
MPGRPSHNRNRTPSIPIRTYIIFFITILCISGIYYSYKFTYELFESNIYDEIQCVVARYNEDTDWFKEEPFNKFNMICYNKGPKLPENCFTNNCKIIELENVGRCDHTYLYHIINNYDNLAPITFFLPASCMDPHKQQFTLNVLKHLMETKTTVLQGGVLNNIHDDLYDFTLDEWQATNPKNISINPESQLQKSPIRPFGKWFDANFDKDLKIKIFCYYGIIGVAREHIIQHPIERYKNLIKYVNSSSNPEAGHYIERSWVLYFIHTQSHVYIMQVH